MHQTSNCIYLAPSTDVKKISTVETGIKKATEPKRSCPLKTSTVFTDLRSNGRKFKSKGSTTSKSVERGTTNKSRSEDLRLLAAL